MKTDPRIDAYIAKAQPFARPILSHIRALAAAALPADAEETLKWGMPSFTHKGAIVAGMGAFKQHATFGFWYGTMVTGMAAPESTAMGSFGRITALSDLPSDAEIRRMFADSVALIDKGVKPARMAEKKPPKPEATVPPALAAALAAHAGAQARWDAFPPSHRREYCEWVAEAKRDETRDRRVAQAIEWIVEGKNRNWKYNGC